MPPRSSSANLIALGEDHIATLQTEGAQAAPVIAPFGDGGALLAWEGVDPESGLQKIYLSATQDGAIAFETALPSVPVDVVHSDPALIALQDGGYALAWIDSANGASTVYLGFLDEAGSLQGAPEAVSDPAQVRRTAPTLVQLEDGSVTVGWQSLDQDGSGWGLYASRVTAPGEPASAAFALNTTTALGQTGAALTATGSGFLAVWESQDSASASTRIIARLFDGEGTALSDERVLSSTSGSVAVDPSLATLTDGRIAVTWAAEGADADGRGVLARLLGADGQPLGAAFAANDTTSDDQEAPAILAAEDGGFVIAWQSFGQDGAAEGIFARRFDATGTPMGPEVQINTHTPGAQTMPALALDGMTLTATWQSEGQDGSGSGVYSRAVQLNSTSEALPEIVGAAQEHATLNADVSQVSDADGLGEITYQWLRNGDPIEGATAASYTLMQADVGAAISVTVSYTDGLGTTETLTSAATTLVENRNGAPEGEVHVFGEAVLGGRLNAVPDGLADSDGLGALHYQWLRDGEPIDGATEASLLLGARDIDAQLSVVVSYTDGAGTRETLASAQSDPVGWPVRETGSNAQPVENNETPRGAFLYTLYDNIPFAPRSWDLLTLQDSSTIIFGSETFSSAEGESLAAYRIDRDDPLFGTSLTRGDTASPENQLIKIDLPEGMTATEAGLSAVPLGRDKYLLYWQIAEDDGGYRLEGKVFDLDPTIATSSLQVHSPLLGEGAGLSRLVPLDEGAFLLIRQQDGIISAQKLGAHTVEASYEIVSLEETPLALEQAVLLQSGNLAVIWTTGSGAKTEISGQVVSPDGAPIGDPFEADSLITGAEARADIAALSGGGFVLVWQSSEDEKSGVFAQVFGDDGSPLDKGFPVSTGIPDQQETPSVVALPDGGFAIAWSTVFPEESDYYWGPGYNKGIALRIFDAAGTPTSDESLLHSQLQTLSFTPKLALDSAGNLTALWQDLHKLYSIGLGFEYTTYIQTFDLNDAPTGTVEVSGTAQTGSTLLLDAGTLADPDGLGSFSYAWYRDGQKVDWAVSDSYTLSDADWGQHITASVSYTDGAGNLETVYSAPSAPILEPEQTTEALPSSQDDRLTGNAGGTWTDLAAGNDRFDALGGDDTVYGGTGDDTLIGGAGSDSLHGDAGDDLLIGGIVEDVSATSGALAFRLYQAAFDRLPDSGGFADWSARLESGEVSTLEAASGFVASKEFQNTYGALGDDGFVTLLYANVLDRAPDAPGLTDWTQRLEGGLSREQVFLGFADSREFRAATNDIASTYATHVETRGISIWADDIYRLYRATLDRAPDLTGLQDWLGKMVDGQDILDVTAGFTGSTEFRNTYGALDDAAFVEQLYTNILGRLPESTGLTSWTDQLDAGQSRESVVNGIVQSREFRRATAEQMQEYLTDTQTYFDGGTGDDTLSGSLLRDVFVFDTDTPGHDHVLQFDAWDTLVFNDFGYDHGGGIFEHLEERGNDLVFEDQGVTITFVDTTEELFRASALMV